VAKVLHLPQTVAKRWKPAQDAGRSKKAMGDQEKIAIYAQIASEPSSKAGGGGRTRGKKNEERNGGVKQ